MSRIFRYQESINRFIKKKSCINNLDNNIKTNMLNIINDNNHVNSIILLTVLGTQGFKSGKPLHGYYMAAGIEIMEIIANITDNRLFFDKKYGKQNIDQLLYGVIGSINICLSQNIESIQQNINKDELINVFSISVKLIGNKLNYLLLSDTVKTDGYITKSDIIKFHFSKFDSKNVSNKLKKIKQANKKSLMDFIQRKYGVVCELSLVLGWLLGGGNKKMVKKLEKMGKYLAIMIKSSRDFVNLESDLEIAKDSTNNMIINLGFQNTFELFMDNKQKFIEGCIVMDIYTNTVKEVIDLMESKIDTIIDQSSPDMKSHYTLESIKT